MSGCNCEVCQDCRRFARTIQEREAAAAFGDLIDEIDFGSQAAVRDASDRRTKARELLAVCETGMKSLKSGPKFRRLRFWAGELRRVIQQCHYLEQSAATTARAARALDPLF